MLASLIIDPLLPSGITMDSFDKLLTRLQFNFPASSFIPLLCVVLYETSARILIVHFYSINF